MICQRRIFMKIRAVCSQIRSKTTGECVQFYYFWKKIRIDPRRTHLNKTNLKSIDDDANSTITTTTSLSSGQQESRIYVCDRPNCSAVSVPFVLPPLNAIQSPICEVEGHF